jgi:hypothetical protein
MTDELNKAYSKDGVEKVLDAIVDKDYVVSYGITPEYEWHSIDLIKKHMDNLVFEVSQLVTNLEKRRTDHLSVINNLLKENQKLKNIIKESKNA